MTLLNEQLESLVDREGLSAVVGALVEICGLKAEHLESNWQDRLSALRWEKDGATLERAKLKLHW